MIHKENTHTVIWHNNLSELFEQKPSNINIPIWDNYIDNRLSKESYNFIGAKNLKELINIVELHGWAEGAEKGKKKLLSFKVPSLPYTKRKRIRAFQGHALDIHAVNSGQLHRAWESSIKKRISNNNFKGHINIIIDVSANCLVSSNNFFWRGAIGCILSDALIKSGRSVRIIMLDCTKEILYCANNPCYNRIIIATVLKPFNSPLDLNNMFSCTALIGFFRYYQFKAISSIEEKINSNFGYVAEFNINDIEFFLDGAPCITISNIWTEQEANIKLQQLANQIEGK